MEVAEILERVDILEYIRQYCDLEKKSDGEYWGLSPFKEEKTPSFSVSQEKQRFYDFSTGTGGNLISFIEQYQHCDFLEALRTLKKYAKITDDTPGEIKRLEATKIAKKYRKQAPKTKETTYAVLPSDCMERYEFLPEKLQCWVDEGISLETMKQFGVRYDSFSDRIVFPIRNYDGGIINICGRTLDPDFKQKKLRKYTYFKQFGGALDTIYGIAENREAILKAKRVILFEGAKSVMIAHEWGVCNTGAILTSHLNPQQFLFLAKLGASVVFALDKEVDVTEDKQIQRLKRYVNVETIRDTHGLLDEKMSPVDRGKEVFIRLYKERVRV